MRTASAVASIVHYVSDKSSPPDYLGGMGDKDICYTILLSRIPGVETSRETVMRHIAHIKSLDDQGQLVLAGPFEDFPGGMVIVRAESAEAAKKIAESDPFVTEGVRTFEVRTWMLANRENGYLG